MQETKQCQECGRETDQLTKDGICEECHNAFELSLSLPAVVVKEKKITIFQRKCRMYVGAGYRVSSTHCGYSSDIIFGYEAILLKVEFL